MHNQDQRKTHTPGIFFVRFLVLVLFAFFLLIFPGFIGLRPGFLGHENHGVYVCHKCGWPFPNPHPSAKHRRAHKKICGTVEGYKRKQNGSDDERVSDDDYKTPGLFSLCVVVVVWFSINCVLTYRRFVYALVFF